MKDKGVNVTKTFEIGLTGSYTMATFSPLGAVQCEAHATLLSSGGSTANITKFEMKNCAPFGSGLPKCIVGSSEAKGLPWSVTVNSTDLTIKNVSLKHTFIAGCPASEMKATFPTVEMLPDVASSISQFSWFGKNALGDEMAAEFKVDSPNTGLYGIG